jgi:hypothetical protein
MDEVDTDDLAWECLRRNAKYQNDFSMSLASATDTFKTRWGLRFPRTSEPHWPGANHILDA